MVFHEFRRYGIKNNRKKRGRIITIYQGFEIISCHGNLILVDVYHLNHTPTSGNGS